MVTLLFQASNESLQSYDDTNLSTDETQFQSQHGGAPIIMPSLNSSQQSVNKKKGLFRRHKKTPSSPARLLNPAGSDLSLTGSNTSELSVGDDESLAESCLECRALACTENNDGQCADDFTDCKNCDHSTMDDSRRRSNGNTSLRRGKPNTVTSGLPPDRYIPSPDRSRRSYDGEATGAGLPIRQSSQREIFASPERRELCCDTVAFDTSPILKLDTKNPASFDDDLANTSVASGSVGDRSISRELSTVSIVSMASDFDCAFLHESFADQADESHLNATVSTNNTSVLSKTDDSFKKPLSCKVPKTTSTSDCTAVKSAEDGNLNKAASETDISKPSNIKADNETTPIKAAQSLDSVLPTRRGLKTTNNNDSVYIKNNNTLRTPRRHTVQVPPILQIPNLPISSDMQHMLVRAGMLEEDTRNKSLSSSSRESVVNLLEQGKVSTNVRQFTESLTEKLQDEELAKKHASPLRFPKARQRGSSPVRIPTIFALADSETAGHYRNLASKNTSIDATGSTTKTKASLPISTSLLRSESVENAKQKLSGNETVELDEDKKPLKDSSNLDRIEGLDVTHTPKIKANLLPKDMGKRMPRTLAFTNTPRSFASSQRYRKSPMKPVKRLRGSPQSPKSPKHRKSPNGLNNRKHGLSPIPTHIADWNV